MKRFFLSRNTILLLISLMLASVVTGYFIPQRFLTAPEELLKWQATHPVGYRVTSLLGLDHIYTSPLFALLLLLFLISLSVSTLDQFRAAWRRTFRGMPVGAEAIETSADPDAAARAIRRVGYLPVGSDPEVRRFVRNPWGYWGNFCLHAGIVISIVGCLCVVLFEKRGMAELIIGEVHAPGAAWATEDRGLIAGHLTLPESVRLDGIRHEFYDTDNLKQLYLNFSFIDRNGRQTPYSMHINQTVYHGGIRAFQGKMSGHAFYVSLTDERGVRHDEIFLLPYPRDRVTAGAKRFALDWTPYDFRAKYYTDVARRSMEAMSPELSLRLVDGKRVAAEVTLTAKGQTERLGPYTATLVEVRPWAGLIFMDTPGMPILFAGFFIVVLGGFLHYFMPPREFSVAATADGIRIGWTAPRYAGLYRSELESAITEMSGASRHAE